MAKYERQTDGNSVALTRLASFWDAAEDHLKAL
jgi:hypothetical protein